MIVFPALVVFHKVHYPHGPVNCSGLQFLVPGTLDPLNTINEVFNLRIEYVIAKKSGLNHNSVSFFSKSFA